MTYTQQKNHIIHNESKISKSYILFKYLLNLEEIQMKKNIFKKALSFIITLLIFYVIIIQIASPKKINIRNTITVDDEPGDAGYTSLKEAIINVNTGDTIEVYSGTYIEDEISIFISDLTISGIPNELGQGNDLLYDAQ